MTGERHSKLSPTSNHWRLLIYNLYKTPRVVRKQINRARWYRYTLLVGVVFRLTSIYNRILHKQWWGHHKTGTSHVTILKSIWVEFLYVMYSIYLCYPML